MTRPELDAETKARIEAEEAYRAEVRARQSQAVAPPQPQPTQPSTPPPLSSGWQGNQALVWFVGIFVLLGVLYQCNIGGSSTSTPSVSKPADPIDYGDFAQTCQNIITGRLKSPSTAKFSNYYSDKDAGLGIGSYSGGFLWNGTVDSQNGFGAMIRTTFSCSTDPGSTMVSAHINE